MKYWNKTLRAMDEYIPGEQPANIEEYIKLNTNENPFPPSEKVLKAITDHVNANLRRYPDSKAKGVRQIFADQNNLTPDNIFVGNGSDEIFTLIFRGLIDNTGLAAFPYPSYSLYDTLAQGNGIKYEKIDLTADLQIDMDRFLAKKYDMVIISNPNNPTGSYVSAGRVKEFLKSYKGLLIMDEAYIDFYGGSAIELVNDFDNLIVTRSYSKSYSLAGLRVGLAIANPDIIEGLVKIKDSYNVDALALAGAEAALLDTRSFEYNLGMLRNNKEYLEERLTDMNFMMIPSRGNFIFTKHPDIDSRELYEKLKDAKILIRHFRGPVQSEYVRISIGSMMEIKKLCSAIEAILGGV